MKKPSGVIDIFLQPGDFYFGNKETRISTLLGSCVAITIWHPIKLIGGMCHFMLPSNQLDQANYPLNGKYADQVMQMFLNEIRAANTIPEEYQAKVFGAGHMFSEVLITPQHKADPLQCEDPINCTKVSCRNAFIAPQLLKENNFQVVKSDLGGTKCRRVIFDIWSGDVWLRKGS